MYTCTWVSYRHLFAFHVNDQVVFIDDNNNNIYFCIALGGVIQVLCIGMRCGGIRISANYQYAGVRSYVFSIAKEWGVLFPEKSVT